MEWQELPAYRRRIGVVLAVLGIASSMVAGVGLLRPVLRRQETITVEAAASQNEPKQATAVSRVSSVVIEKLTYEPGADSGWHFHPGVHAVLILSGTLEIYDAVCSRHVYGPGTSFVSGQHPHLARNATDDPVVMSVTYVIPPGRTLARFRAPAERPRNCSVE